MLQFRLDPSIQRSLRSYVKQHNMLLKRKRTMILVSIFMTSWFVIILYTPSPSSTNKHRNNIRTKPKNAFQKYQSKLLPKPPRIKIVDVDEGVSDDEEERRRELQLRNANKDISDIKRLTVNPLKVQDSQDVESNAVLSIELDLIHHEIPGMRTPSAVWNLAGSWVKKDQITPAENPDLGAILQAMTTRHISKADVGYRGTQLKATLQLLGGQWVVFKPGRYKRKHVIEGTPYAGYDRHNGEIAAFHLNRVLGFHRAPIVVGRRINMRTEIMPVASQILLDTFINQRNRTCFYGKCYYCKPDEPACADEHDMMEGSLTLWLPKDKKLKKWRHLWSRTYRENQKARWEYDDTFCEAVLQKFPLVRHRLLADMLDTSAFDYLIGNADRHEYETFEADGDQGMLLLMDSAKSFGNPHHDEKSILAPLYQCCKIRKSTWYKLLSLQEGRLSHVMRRVLSHDPLAPILTDLHLQAMDRRLVVIIATIQKCIKTHGEKYVLII